MTLDTAPFFEQTFAGAPLMAILRSAGVERAVRVARTAWELGLDSVEGTIQSDADVDALREVARLGRERGAVVGAGTIVSPDQVQVAIDAGAGYLVSPGLDADVVRAAQAAGIPILAGVATPSEVQRAVALGLTWLKAFPAQWLGTDCSGTSAGRSRRCSSSRPVAWMPRTPPTFSPRACASSPSARRSKTRPSSRSWPRSCVRRAEPAPALLERRQRSLGSPVVASALRRRHHATPNCGAYT